MDKRIVLVANLPCSAGTYLFHYIAKALDANAWLTGETNPYSYNSPTTYFPEDPLHRVRALELFSRQEALKEYSRRLELLVDTFLANDAASVLMIRDHSFGEGWRLRHFPDGSATPALVEILDSRQIPHTCFYTHRDPFDTWLAMRRSFSSMAKAFKRLDDYADFYFNSWLAWKNHSHPLNDLHMQTLALHEQREKDRIRSSVLGMTTATRLEVAEQPIQISRAEMGSGASGRKAERPLIMERHPFTTDVFREAVHSQSLHRLREALGYETPISMTTRTRLSCLTQDLKAVARRLKQGGSSGT
ncbi:MULTISPECIES: hypothetical protein [unclassified Cyanobium]|uniref:hypothetical protein n=1 Tax=unclassified Cyanobium TaxID=2627006 RepID=UPI0020CC8E8D|nr:MULTISPECIES: hypothetical protein [unclassified Cyanobium]MCP9833766.1 hypothetical protein [Cyanobium sp. La Preciosa 7G6]MCP9936476.1 hypothetical protein [Cyanobium sp. Aljojuca 7A6]